ncbi:ABC transporter substrate-binding protein [Roseococcus pinisoli]|uniref:ABC transporter substrate-binding protein n=1 Tax=Roseococcus pinisoli TaxID=2835040 RepID=A0ABS5QJU1_9PROT|nr:ABC transporter substrate-binding protein [Roseococcus pinisoli]MBS7813716.1 ABC transporter substrate-binding protein [Roseococcus pinisoli]
MRRRILLAAPFLPLAGAARAEGWPRLLEDGLGRGVAIPAPPRRIVGIFASNVEMLASLGLVPRLVGIEAYTRFPPEVVNLPKVGGRLGFSAEAIARLEPDLVVMTPARQAAHLLIEPLSRLGIPCLVVLHSDLPRIFANIDLLARATDTEERAAELLRGLPARLAAVSARLAGRPPVRVFLETSSTGRGAYGTPRPDTYTMDILIRAGGIPALPPLPAAGPAQVSGEAILRADPDVYLVAGRPDQAAEVARRPGFDGIAAVRQARVHVVSRAELLIPGPRAVNGVESVARILHPEAFPA